MSPNQIKATKATPNLPQLQAAWRDARDTYRTAQWDSDHAYQDVAFEHFSGSFDQFQNQREDAAAAALKAYVDIGAQLIAAGHVPQDDG